MIKAPYLEINISKLYDNTKKVVDIFGVKGIEVTGITKVVLGEPRIALCLISAGVNSVGDSRIENIIRMREDNINAKFILIRTPSVSEAHYIVRYADISFNTELSVIRELANAAIKQDTIHDIVLMVEMGDLREGILQHDLDKIIGKVIKMKGVRLVGLGTNLACFGGIRPTRKNMDQFSFLAEKFEKKYNMKFRMISGGNSANFDWLFANKDIGRVNNIRLGESIFIGRETLSRKHIEGMHLDAITLVGEVIESKFKDSLPEGEIGQDAFGKTPLFEDKGKMLRAIVGLGRQDVSVDGLTPLIPVDIIGSSSDHLILDATRFPLSVGGHVKFRLNYAALLSCMTSPFVARKFI